MLDESTFLAALAAQPDDTVTRLAFADWLDENDQPDKARFLRAECALPSQRGDRGRFNRLEDLGKSLPPEWLGLVGRPRISGTVWLSHLMTEAVGCPAGHYFRPDGVLLYYYTDHPKEPTPGAWKQFGPRLVYHINQGGTTIPYSFHTARIHGNKLLVSSRNVAKHKWRETLLPSTLPPPPDPVRKRRRNK
jgi:uncharacterized protein (TIGR02996 family)